MRWKPTFVYGHIDAQIDAQIDGYKAHCYPITRYRWGHIDAYLEAPRWTQAMLDDVKKRADEIYERLNVT